MASFHILCVFLCLISTTCSQVTTHIVYLGNKDESIHPDEITELHYQLLKSSLGSYKAAKESLVYSYRHGFSGFAARLTNEQAYQISGLSNVVSVFPSRHYRVHTTESWDFLGLSGDAERSLYGYANTTESLLEKSKYGEDIIIGVLDSGIWPESASFTDDLMGPVPTRWKGACEHGELFNSSNCNRKIIGARFFPGDIVNTSYAEENRELLSPRDVYGHGTHTASTVAGASVKNANWLEYAKGTARGGAPRSRIAVYKVCWRIVERGHSVCPEESILAAFDMGVHDGVDVFSASLGSLDIDYLNGMAIGSFHAVQKGIIVVASAGNHGLAGTVANVAPWIITVAASTIDRKFYRNISLGNNETFPGLVVGEHKLRQRWHSLVSGSSAALPSSNVTDSEYCFQGSLDPKKVKNKIVACLLGLNTSVVEVERCGGVGMILCASPTSSLLVEGILLTNISVLYADTKDGEAIFSYINSTRYPRAYISHNPITKLHEKPAPVMATFSSKGPNIITPDILKPDITAPGVNILAAYSQYDDENVIYKLESGTSMSCPHVSGIVALLKSYRPDWSPAAIKSAIVTTGFLADNLGDPIKTAALSPADPFDFGGGHINPNAAAHPGLIYDADEQDYIGFLCSLNYTSNWIQGFTQTKRTTCPENVPDASNLNYPSIAVSNLKTTRTVTRRVTNVDGDATVYRATVSAPDNVNVTVHPSELKFIKKGEIKTFKVTFGVKEYFSDYSFGYLTWSNGKYSVTSPIVISVNNV